MEITAIETMKLYVPWKESLANPMRRWRAMMGTTPEEEDAYVVIRMLTDEGLVGLGEGGRSMAEAEREAQRFIGQNPMSLPLCDLQPPFLHACADLVAQALEVPACRILGGCYRERVSVAYWSPYLPPEETMHHAEEGAALGFTLHKIKARPWDAVQQVQAIAKAVGRNYSVRIDPNETFALPATTVRIASALRDEAVECLEDPVPKARPEWWALLRQKCEVPLALHSSDGRLIMEMARRGGIDYVNVGGSPNTCRAAAAVADAAGCPVWVQFEGHCLDIAAAFDIHMAAAIPNATLPSDILPFLREASIAREPLDLRDGYYTVPTASGLGVTLDEQAVARYRVA
jgi:L-alanine-DL-glutamate epimerase-like enolase superfamily enzyme